MQPVPRRLTIAVTAALLILLAVAGSAAAFSVTSVTALTPRAPVSGEPGSNEEAFRRWRIIPRMLRDVSARDLSTAAPCSAPTAGSALGLAPSEPAWPHHRRAGLGARGRGGRAAHDREHGVDDADGGDRGGGRGPQVVSALLADRPRSRRQLPGAGRREVALAERLERIVARGS